MVERAVDGLAEQPVLVVRGGTSPVAVREKLAVWKDVAVLQ